jgi:HKD family nuclease
MPASTIPSGPYLGFTHTELLTELTRYKNAVKQSASRLSGASVNGQSYTFGPRGDWSLDEWQQHLQAALAYFGAAEIPPGDRAVVRFA